MLPSVESHWVPNSNWTLHRKHNVWGEYHWYAVGTTPLRIQQVRVQSGTVWRFTVQLGGQPPLFHPQLLAWQRAWCAGHGFDTATWPTRRALLADLHAAHRHTPFLTTLPPKQSLLRRTPDGYRLGDSDVPVTREDYQWNGNTIFRWRIGYRLCQEPYRVFRLGDITHAHAIYKQQCSCGGCQSRRRWQ
jgi:hypothetical protein